MSAALRLATALSLMGFLAACDADEVDSRMTLITNFGNPPPTEPQEPTPEGANPPLVNDPVPVVNEPPFECVSIFRQQTCENGVLYQLDDQMNWILPGRTG